MNTWIGVDLGGTHMRAAIVDDEGQILSMVKKDTQAGQGVLSVLCRMADAIRLLPGWEDAKGVGLGIPGGVSKDGEMAVLTSNLVGFDGYPVRSYLSSLIGKHVAMENDGNAACLAEALYGTGQGMDTVVYITLSTGIGGGICINGKLLRGAHGCAGEFGCISCDPKRNQNGDLPPGAIESEASGTSLVRKAESSMHVSFSHAGELFDSAASQSPAAVTLIRQAIQDLAVMLSNIACILDPDVIVLGGGLMKSADSFLPELISCYKDFAQPVFRDIPVLRGCLAEPGLIGAAMYAKSMLR
jgi:glucokinase